MNGLTADALNSVRALLRLSLPGLLVLSAWCTAQTDLAPTPARPAAIAHPVKLQAPAAEPPSPEPDSGCAFGRPPDPPAAEVNVAAPSPENHGLSGDGPIGVYGHSAEGHGVYGVTEESLPWAAAIAGVTGLHASTGNTGRLGAARSGVEGYSADRYGVHGETRTGYGVIGEATGEKGGSRGVSGFSSSSEGVGVNGAALAVTGGATGVVGETHSPDGVGVRAVGSGARGIALELVRGGIRVTDAGIESQTPVFLLEATGRNGCGRKTAVFCAFTDNVLINGRPDALLLVTPFQSRVAVSVEYGGADGTTYCPKDRWMICTIDESGIIGRKFFVLAVLP